MKKFRLNLGIFLVLLISSDTALSQDLGSIPLNFNGKPAVDLRYEGRGITPRLAKRLHRRGLDLSTLNPKETDIWRNSSKVILTKKMDELGISKTPVFEYIDNIAPPRGVFRFSVRESGDVEVPKNFSVWMSLDSRATLLRKNLMRKLGYYSPRTKQVQEFKLRFPGVASLEAFIVKMEGTLLADSKRWIVKRDDVSAELTIQDVLVIESNFTVYNFTTGEIPAEYIARRRSINALLIPFAICDVRETIDGLGWSAGRVDANQLLFDAWKAENFTTTYNDARWILRRMSKLTRADFEEIVKFAYYPESVAKLLVEKLISRYNSIQQHFGLGKSKLKVNDQVSHKNKELISGRLQQNKWKGHASRYSYEDTPSPLSGWELFSFFRSKVNSNIIDNLVSVFNEKYLFKTDIQEEAIKRQIEAQKEQFLNLIINHKYERIPFSVWSLPTLKGNILASRDIVTGSYMGTDNAIQIADTIEILADAGLFLGTTGLPTPYMLSGGINARYTRSYTHVKSITSIKKALKEPFRNMLVPFLKYQKGKSLERLIDELQSKVYTDLEGDKRRDALEKILKKFNKVLSIGESMIIANNLVFSGGINGGIKLPVIKLGLGVNARRLDIWRLHILRSDENTIQIYKSKAGAYGAGIGINLSAYMPILSLSLDSQKGKVKTLFNTISVNEIQSDDELVRGFKELRQILFQNSEELLTARKKPFVVAHNFKQNSYESSLFFMKDESVDTTDTITLKNPEGYKTKILVRTEGERTGRNYEKLTMDILNGILEYYLESDNQYNIGGAGSGNSGDSFKGKSYSRMVTLELPLDDEASMIPFELYSIISKQWKGWKASKAKIEAIVEHISKKYGTKIFSDDLLAGTKEIQLYSVDLTISIYQEGIENLIHFDRGTFEKMINEDLFLPWPKNRSHWKKRGRKKFNVYERKLKQVRNKLMRNYNSLNSGKKLNKKSRSKFITTMLNLAEENLPFPKFVKLVGGMNKMYVRGKIGGFRVNTEDGEKRIISHSLGEFGSEFTDGAMATLRDTLKISTGELGAFWFMRRLQ